MKTIFFIQLQLLYILQQMLGVKVSDKFFLLRCFLGPEITYIVHFLCIILCCYLVEIRLIQDDLCWGQGVERKGKVSIFLTCSWRGLQIWPRFSFFIENLSREAGESACAVTCLGWRGASGGFWEEQGVFVLASAALSLEPGIRAS